MSKLVLAVDDSSSILEIIRSVLERHGYEVITALDGTIATQYLDGRAIDLVITDINMPEMNGILLIEKIRQIEEYKYTPILVLTSSTQHQHKLEAKSAGATGWINKPFVSDKLIAAINKIVR